MLRLALSKVAPNVDPTDWSFAAGRYGRPFVAAPATSTALHFSLSHADGCVACVVSGHEAVGVDVETVSRRVAPLSTALRFFAPEEVETLRGLPEPAAIERFFDYWTLKEAYLKARGFGLNLPLDAFAMQVSHEAIEISFKPDIADDPHAWRFSLCSPSPSHRLAIADGSRANGGLPISRNAWPLQEAAE
jgi:4'-phosphopantetheinyl transferase